MGLFNSLFGGTVFAGKASDAQILDKGGVEQAVEKPEHTPLLFARALGRDLEDSSYGARRRAAIKLVLANETAKGREAWLSIARDFPNQFSFALEQVGICYHLEKDYRSALESYEAAIRVGADERQLAENIAEARKGMAAVG